VYIPATSHINLLPHSFYYERDLPEILTVLSFYMAIKPWVGLESLVFGGSYEEVGAPLINIV
jgi:hypothetical protein